MISSHRPAKRGFTLIEILAIIATLAILFAILLADLAKQKSKNQRITCVGNLKQIGLSLRIWAGDYNDKYPMQISTNGGGSMEFVESTNTYRHFQLLSNELAVARLVACPADKNRLPAADFLRLANSNLGYFVGPDASENLPQSILSGDRNITNGFSPTNGMLVLTKNQLVGWTEEMHKFQGNLALGDGSVQQVNSLQFRTNILANSDLATNRIQLP